MAGLEGKTIFITGASRGIGKAIGLMAAGEGANVVIASKTTKAHPKLPGTIFTAAQEMEEAGGKALPCAVDVRSEEDVLQAVSRGVDQFGGIDILVNNASAISLSGTRDTEMKRYDLMSQVNARGTFLCSKACLPHLENSSNPHILNISPPLNLEAKWFAPHLAYTMAKFGMSLCVLGMSAEFSSLGIGVNALWPKTTIATAAIRNLLGGEDVARRSRKPAIMADAAREILTQPASELSGNFFIDEEVLANAGVTDLSSYSVEPGSELMPDFFI